MLEAFISGFWQVVAWPAFGYMLIGIAIGFWVGLLPGIGGLSTLALMLPFSYNIKDPVSAFAFLLGMLAVTGTTGDLTSILFGIPGEGSSAPYTPKAQLYAWVTSGTTELRRPPKMNAAIGTPCGSL
jgi:TctA family transporter